MVRCVLWWDGKGGWAWEGRLYCGNFVVQALIIPLIFSGSFCTNYVTLGRVGWLLHGLYGVWERWGVITWSGRELGAWMGEWTDEWMSGWCWVMGLYYSMGSISIDTRLPYESVGRCRKFKILKNK